MREDLERALRNVNANHVEAHDALLQLAAHVVALTDELARRLGDPDLAEAVAAAIPAQLEDIRLADARGKQRVDLDPADDKYTVAGADVPCLENMPICGARCCVLRFPLSSVDLDEGVIKWDYGKPYQIRQRASDGRCVHNEAGTGHCTVHTQRPRACRVYDCRGDSRIWLDYERRIPAPLSALEQMREPEHAKPDFDPIARLRARRLAHELERETLDETFGEK